MVTEHPTGSGSPHKPKKVWKPKPAGEGGGVPSMFAHAVLSKPLKINSAVTTTVKVKSKETTTNSSTGGKKENKASHDTTGTHTRTPSASNTSNTSNTVTAPTTFTTLSTPKSKLSAIRDTAVRPAEPVQPVQPVIAATTTTYSTKGFGEAAKGRPSTSTKASADGVKKATPKSEESHRKSNQSTLVIGGCTTVAGTPQSWPKPHAVSGAEKPKPHRASGKADKDDEQFHKEIDHLIPEMYRKKSAKQLEEEQQEEIQLMRRIMWELQQLEMARQEEALRCKPIAVDVDTTLNLLKNAKKMNDMLDDHASLDDSDTSSKRKTAYSTHVKSKLAFFSSHHSVSHDSSDSVDSSSVSSWNSDESDGLFRG